MSDVEIDLFAVRIVVREAKYMALNIAERHLAARLLKEKGYSSFEAADILRCTPDMVGKYWRVAPPIPLDEVPDDVVGQRWNHVSPTLQGEIRTRRMRMEMAR